MLSETIFLKRGFSGYSFFLKKTKRIHNRKSKSLNYSGLKICSLLIGFVLLFSSCRDLVQSEFPAFTPVPAINSILAADSLFRVHVSLAGRIDSNQLDLIDNAEVELFIDGQFKETLDYTGQGIYSSTTIVEPLKNYVCEVAIPGFQKLSCRQSVPQAATISEIVHINQAGKDPEGFTYPAIKFTFNNNPFEKQYFEVAIKMIKHGYELQPDLTTITDPVLLNEGLPIALFSNELIGGDSYTMTINYLTGSGGSSGTNLYPLLVELRTLSYDYYKYVRQLYLYEKGRSPDFGSGLTAFPLYSNIEGGYGIFAGYSAVVSDTINPNQFSGKK